MGAKPKWSPDGQWISYGVNKPGSNLIYVVPAAGGSPRQLAPELASARPPIWSPDGKYLLFLGSDQRGEFDWWVAPFEGAGVFQTDAFATIRRHHLNSFLGSPFDLSSRALPSAWLANGNRIVFAATLADSTNLWTVSIDPSSWKVTGAPQRLTFGTGH